MPSFSLATRCVPGRAIDAAGLWYLWGQGCFERALDVLLFGVESFFGLDSVFSQFKCNVCSLPPSSLLVAVVGAGFNVAAFFPKCALSPHRLVTLAINPADAHLV